MGGTLTIQSVDLSSKVAVVTGGNAGIGYETAKGLALMGAHTIIACRSEEKAKIAIEQMRQEVSLSNPEKSINVEFMKLDLSSFQSTKEFAVAFKEKNIPLHILINNAGIFGVPFTLTEDGNELHFQVNHLSHFLLTMELLPVILDTAGNTGDCRIVIVSSVAHEGGVFVPTNLNGEQSYGRYEYYKNTKLFNVMHGFALQRRLRNTGVTVSSLHPGMVQTYILDKGVSDHAGISALVKISKFLIRPGLRDCQQGSLTTLNCAVNPELNKQQHYYYADCQVKPPSPRATVQEQQEELWEISVQKVKNWLSPEILEKYGTRLDGTSDQPAEQSATEENACSTSTQSEKHAQHETTEDKQAVSSAEKESGLKKDEKGEEERTDVGHADNTEPEGTESLPAVQTSVVQGSENDENLNKQQQEEEGTNDEDGAFNAKEPAAREEVNLNGKDEKEEEQ